MKRNERTVRMLLLLPLSSLLFFLQRYMLTYSPNHSPFPDLRTTFRRQPLPLATPTHLLHPRIHYTFPTRWSIPKDPDIRLPTSNILRPTLRFLHARPSDRLDFKMDAPHLPYRRTRRPRWRNNILDPSAERKRPKWTECCG